MTQLTCGPMYLIPYFTLPVSMLYSAGNLPSLPLLALPHLALDYITLWCWPHHLTLSLFILYSVCTVLLYPTPF